MGAGGQEANFDYAGYFSRIRELERLTLNADEVGWQEKFNPPQQRVDVLLYLGCNVLITSHLAIEVVRVFDRLGIDFETVGGPQFCCGVLHHSHAAFRAASRLSGATMQKIKAYGAKALVLWCPTCDLHLNDVVLPSLGSGLGAEVTHAAQFLADRVAFLPLDVPIPSRVAVHTHGGHPRQDRDTRAVLSLLRSVPGIDVAGVLKSEHLDYHCATPSNAEARVRFEAERQSLLDEACSLGADTVVTLYHSCQREWCETSSESLRIRNYISIVAESMRCGAEDRYTTLRQLPSARQVVEGSRPQWSSHGWDERRAAAAAAFLAPRPPSRHKQQAADPGKERPE